MSDDLVSRLSETLDEAERVALVAKAAGIGMAEWTAADGELFATDGVWSPDRCSEHERGVPNHCDDSRIATVDGDILMGVVDQDAVFGHIARWDPQAVLRLVAAHRKIIDEHHRALRRLREGEDAEPTHLALVTDRFKSLQRVVRILAEGWGLS